MGKNKYAFILCWLLANSIYGWGFMSHQHINKQAVFCLPADLFGFYKRHIKYITESAVNPDKRRYILDNEAEKHFLDIDHYPDTILTQKPHWHKAVETYTDDSLRKHGILPWNILLLKYQLTEAFKTKDITKILKLSADVGHYLGDACVPLHTTQNYNGQLSNQVGIHGLWETRIPELHLANFNFWQLRAQYINNWHEKTWELIAQSHHKVDSVLSIEKNVSEHFPEDKKYQIEARNGVNVKTYSRRFTKAYHQQLNGMVEHQMRTAIAAVSSFWYTCWIDGGQPNLDNQAEEITDPESEELTKKTQNIQINEPDGCNGKH
jgi:hypothetical protein